MSFSADGNTQLTLRLTIELNGRNQVPRSKLENIINFTLNNMGSCYIGTDLREQKALEINSASMFSFVLFHIAFFLFTS